MTATLRLDPWTLHLRNGAADALRGRPLGVLPPRMIEPDLNEQLARVSRRTKVWELSNHLHCSIVGTCLSTGELRQVLSKAGMAVDGATDHDLHGQGVLLANLRDARGKLLHKALDKRHRLVIGRFDRAKTIDEVRALWRDAVKQGDIPGGYWAALTHPATNDALIRELFGEVHMLSHLVGAANRADICRLVALEEENAALKEKVERQQSRLQELSTQRDATIAALNAQIAQLSAHANRQLPADAASLEAEAQQLRDKLDDADQRVALHTSRRETAEQRTLQEQEAALALRRSRDQALALVKLVQSECDALERATVDAADSANGSGMRRTSLDSVRGKRIVYVGGRPGSNAALKRLVEAAGGDFVVHDGGVEDRKGLLAAALPGADIVVFPVDCVDHDSMNTLKRVCERHQIDYHPLRTASVASFVELMARLHPEHVAQLGNPPPSAFCLRHG